MLECGGEKKRKEGGWANFSRLRVDPAFGFDKIERERETKRNDCGRCVHFLGLI